MLHLKCLTVLWICLCLSNCSLICTVTLCYALHQTHSEFWQISNLFFQVYAGILNYIQAYSGIFSTLSKSCISQRCHIVRSGIFRTGELFKILLNVDQHIQNSAIGQYSGIFRTLWKACIHRNLAYSESWNI